MNSSEIETSSVIQKKDGSLSFPGNSGDQEASSGSSVAAGILWADTSRKIRLEYGGKYQMTKK